jgi:hypothetical protein
MPEGPDKQKNFMGGPAETDDFLTDKKAGTDDNFEPGGGNPEEYLGAPEIEPDFSPAEQEWFEDDSQQAQLDAQQQIEAATALAGNKQRQLLQIAKERQEAEGQLGELEKNLTKFRNSKSTGFFSIFQPKIKLLIDTILAEMKKGARHLSDEAKVGYYQGLIITVSSLIGILTALKMMAAVLDALFSWLTKAVPSCFTIIGCIFFILILPLYVPFLALIFMLGVIPLMKGRLTKIDAEIIKDLKKQRTAWRAELEVIKKKVTLRKQIKDLNKFEKEVKRWK